MTKGSTAAFAFVDEVGIGFSADQPLFGVGVFFIDDSLELNREIHDIFAGAVSAYRTNKTRFEFKFNAITEGNLYFYKSIVGALAENENWHFSALLFEKHLDTWKSTDYWPAYLTLLEGLLAQTSYEQVVVVADYLAKPKELKGDLSDLLNSSKVVNFLQLES